MQVKYDFNKRIIMQVKYDFKKILREFELTGDLTYCERYGEGHINETYLAVLNDNGRKKNTYFKK